MSKLWLADAIATTHGLKLPVDAVMSKLWLAVAKTSYKVVNSCWVLRWSGALAPAGRAYRGRSVHSLPTACLLRLDGMMRNAIMGGKGRSAWKAWNALRPL